MVYAREFRENTFVYGADSPYAEATAEARRLTGMFGELSSEELTKDPDGPPWHKCKAVLMTSE
jgi:hypothetical protein